MSVKRGKVSLLSFQNDEDDAEDETVVIKSKIGKKQRQLAYRKYEQESTTEDRAESAINYDDEELNALRQSQLYVKERIPVTEDDEFKEALIVEDVVIETLDEVGDYSKEVIVETEKEVEIQGEFNDKVKINTKKKVFFSDSVKTSVQSRREEIEREMQDSMDVAQDDDALSDAILKNSVGYTPSADSVGASMQSIIKLVGGSLDKLAGIHNNNKDAVSRITDNLDALVKASDKLNEDMSAGVSTLNYLLELQLFVTEVVSMLREKVELLKAYKSEYLAVISNSHKETDEKYYVQQEDLLYLLQQQGDLVDLNCGGYKCKYILNSLGVDEFGRSLTAPNQLQRRLEVYLPSLATGVTVDSITLDQLLAGIDDEVAVMVGATTHPLLCTIVDTGDVEKMDKIHTLFADCKSELYSIPNILSKFQQFKASLPTEYNRAFVSYSLPGLVLPLVEYDLVVGVRDRYVISEREWHQAVHQYSVNQAQKSEDNIDDQLLSTMVTTATSLFLQELVVSGLRVVNRHHCIWLGQFLQQIAAYNPTPAQLELVAVEITTKFNQFWTNKLLFPVLKAGSKWGCYYYHRSFTLVHHVLCNLEYLLPVLKPESVRDMVWNLLFGNKNVLTSTIRVMTASADVDGWIVPCLVKIGQLLALLSSSISESDTVKKKHVLLYISTVTAADVSVTEIVKVLRDISSQY
jgi:hypothetical protein